MTGYKRWGKRAFDVCLASAVLVITSPILMLALLLVRVRLGSPVLFVQVRPGRDSKPFRMVKIRTMHVLHGDAVGEGVGEPASDAKRTPGLGRFLRATSIDELPELFNVLRGDMSVVGPRPLLMRYLDRFTSRQALRMQVRPGVTGLAQVSGRNAIGWAERLALDVQYVETCSFLLDLKILTATLGAVLGHRGVNNSDGITMTEFMGARDRAADRQEEPAGDPVLPTAVSQSSER